MRLFQAAGKDNIKITTETDKNVEEEEQIHFMYKMLKRQ